MYVYTSHFTHVSMQGPALQDRERDVGYVVLRRDTRGGSDHVVWQCR
jgi:hypothetical protein